jgi:hypothetical protein
MIELFVVRCSFAFAWKNGVNIKNCASGVSIVNYELVLWRHIMKKGFISLLIVFVGIWLISASFGKVQNVKKQDFSVKSKSAQAMSSVRPDLNFGKIPLYFIINKGQVNKKATFYAKASRYTLWMTKEGLVFDSFRRTENPKYKYRNPKQIKNPNFQNSKQKQIPVGNSPLTTHQRDVSRLSFIGSNKNPEIVPIAETQLRVNYFIGNDRSKWHCDVPTSQVVLYKSLYKNIDLKVYGIEKEIEYDWIVKPGGNYQDIRFAYKSVKSTRMDEEGNLLIETDFGELMHKRPVGYQPVGAGLRACPKEAVEVKFKKIAKNTYGFEVREYDKSRELIIDPVVLVYSTYLGGASNEAGQGIAVDAHGCVYVIGETTSSDFPTLNQYQADLRGDTDVFLTKIDTTKDGASSLIYSTYLGGWDNYDFGRGIAVDTSGCVYITGETRSSDFPTLNQYEAELQGIRDAFVTKLDTTKNGASSLIYSTYLGGDSYDFGRGIAVDTCGCVYVTGETYSTDFPTRNPYQANQEYSDSFLTKLDTTKNGASSLIYSTYLGGNGIDYGWGIAVDSSGDVYVTGSTSSLDFPTLNQYQASQQGYYDAFLTKLDTTKKGASSLIYSTYLGGSKHDYGWGIVVDGSGCAFVTGSTESSDFPILNQYQTYQKGTDVFITKLDTTKNGASSLIYSTYLGGDSQESGSGIAVDASGCVYVAGNTWSSDFPILNECPADHEYSEAYITKLDTTKKGASSLIFSTYLGGSDNNWCNGIALDSSGCIYVTGETRSMDFPTLNEYQAYQGGGDAFITKLVLCTETPSIQLNRSSLYFGAVSGGAQTASQTFSVGISGGCSMQWTAFCQEPWIKVTPTSATGSALVTVSVDTSGLAAGTYTGTVSITCASASNSPQNVTVNLTIHDSASTSVPFGDFSTPLDASVARGSIPVTGWVLDDIQVESVKIYRDGSIYIGDAVFIGGARPDVEASFPTYPFNYRAGWGYMLLTNFFPNGGNGTYTLFAAATDVEGNTITLGAKTIICDNANAVKPFGAIDTPAQGGTASGSGYINYGWVLTPMPNAIPTDGSTIHIYVNGVDLGNPTYNIYRADIASLFPGYANSNGAVGYISLDTTAYTDGTHTIYWTAEDDAGNSDGIGSRYFNIQNSSSSARVFNVLGSMFNAHVQPLWSNVEPGQLPIDYSNPVTVKKGCGRDIEPQKIYPDDNGIITIETRELERVVIHLDGDRTTRTEGTRPFPPTDSYIYLNTSGRLRPLPIGSTFDAERDIFYWQPGPGFLGEYNFVFFKKRKAPATQDGEWQKKIIRIVINPGL